MRHDRAIALRVLDLVEAVLADPFAGIGKPEPLRFYLQGSWSRRITQEHRLAYLVRNDRVDFLQGRYHYGTEPAGLSAHCPRRGLGV